MNIPKHYSETLNALRSRCEMTIKNKIAIASIAVTIILAVLSFLTKTEPVKKVEIYQTIQGGGNVTKTIHIK